MPVRAPHFAVPVGMSAGSPQPLGASVVAVSPPGPSNGGFNGFNGHHGGGSDPRETTCAVNFAVFSRHASSLQLCLVRLEGAEPEGGAGGPLVAQSVLEVVLDPLTNRTGDVWHVCVHGLKVRRGREGKGRGEGGSRAGTAHALSLTFWAGWLLTCVLGFWRSNSHVRCGAHGIGALRSSLVPPAAGPGDAVLGLAGGRRDPVAE